MTGLSVAGIACTCGNKILDSSESCDDGNTVSGDGCSSSCQTESGFTCTGTPSICVNGYCGDGQVSGYESCDNGASNIGFFGCNTNCTGVLTGFTCSSSTCIYRNTTQTTF